MLIKLLDQDNEKAWDAYVNQHQGSSIYHLSEWRHIINHQFGHDSYYLYATEHNNILGILPLVRLRSLFFGDFMVSMPYFNYGGVLADNELIEYSLLEEAKNIGKSIGVAHIEFRELKRRGEDWACRDDKVIMSLELSHDSDILWKAIGSKRRAQIKRPDREGVTINIGGLEILNDFYAVFSRNMRDLGTPVYSRHLFERILKRFPEQSHIVLVRIDNQPAAAGLLIGYKGRMEIPWASSSREYNRTGANMRLYWEALKFSIENKYSVFDFGRSTIDGRTYKFKRQWGAKPVRCYWNYQLYNRESMPQINPENNKYALAIGVWKRLPVAIANILGPMIVKNIP